MFTLMLRLRSPCCSCTFLKRGISRGHQLVLIHWFAHGQDHWAFTNCSLILVWTFSHFFRIGTAHISRVTVLLKIFQSNHFLELYFPDPIRNLINLTVQILSYFDLKVTIFPSHFNVPNGAERFRLSGYLLVNLPLPIDYIDLIVQNHQQLTVPNLLLFYLLQCVFMVLLASPHLLLQFHLQLHQF